MAERGNLWEVRQKNLDNQCGLLKSPVEMLSIGRHEKTEDI